MILILIPSFFTRMCRESTIGTFELYVLLLSVLLEGYWAVSELLDSISFGSHFFER